MNSTTVGPQTPSDLPAIEERREEIRQRREEINSLSCKADGDNFSVSWWMTSGYDIFDPSVDAEELIEETRRLCRTVRILSRLQRELNRLTEGVGEEV